MRPVDVYVGQRVRARRIELGLSLEEVAEALEVHYQQIQRYERGAVRLSGVRLWALSRVLAVRIDYFFHGFEEVPENIDAVDEVSGDNGIATDARSRQLLRRFSELREHEKRALFSLIESMASIDGTPLEK